MWEIVWKLALNYNLNQRGILMEIKKLIKCIFIDNSNPTKTIS